MAQIITDANFEELVKKSDKPVLVDFTATWCGPCKMLSPIIEELATELDGKAVVGKLDVDENPNMSVEFGVRSVPTLLFFKNGELVDRQVGVVPKAVLQEKLNSLM